MTSNVFVVGSFHATSSEDVARSELSRIVLFLIFFFNK